MSEEQEVAAPAATAPDTDAPIRGPAAALLVAAVLVASVLLAAVVGFAFYAPDVGAPTAGTGDPGSLDPGGAAALSRPRDRATVEVAASMAADGQRPTLAEVIEFFALEEDTWACTVTENWGEAAAERADQYARRPLRVGEVIVLCLD